MRGADVFRHPERAVPTPQDYRAAAARIAPYVRRTPVLRAAVGGRPVSLKLEHLQVAGVFKIRGAVNSLLLAGDGAARLEGVVTASGGNHGVGVATAARWLGIPATVFVPGTVPEAKARRIAAQGPDIVKTGSVYADAERAARELAARHGRYYVHAYDDPAVVAGQGTVGLEIVEDIADCDVVAVPVGGGRAGRLPDAARRRGGRRTGRGGRRFCGRLRTRRQPDRRPGFRRLSGQSGHPRAGQRRADPRRPGPAVGGVPAGGRTRGGDGLRRLAGRPDPRR